jgi:phage recombination protein Bet
MNELTTSSKTSLIATMASKYQMDPGVFKDVIKATVMPGNATNEQMAAFLLVANQYGLNPVTKEIHAFPAKGGGVTPVVGIDGWINLAQRRDEFDGMEYDYLKGDDGELDAITCRVYRKDRTRPVEVTEFMSECRRGTDPWRSHPSRMLRHKATIQAIRYAFGFSGIYDEDDAHTMAGNHVYDVKATPADDAHTNGIMEAAKRLREKTIPRIEHVAGEEQAEPEPAIEAAQDHHDAENEWPQANADGELVDVRGIIWDEAVHASSKGCNQDGTWRRRKGVPVGAVEAAEKAQKEHAEEHAEPAGEEPAQADDAGQQDEQKADPACRDVVINYYRQRLTAAAAKSQPRPNIAIIQREVDLSDKLTKPEKETLGNIILDFLAGLDD